MGQCSAVLMLSKKEIDDSQGVGRGSRLCMQQVRYLGKKSSCSRSYLSAKSPQPFSAV